MDGSREVERPRETLVLALTMEEDTSPTTTQLSSMSHDAQRAVLYGVDSAFTLARCMQASRLWRNLARDVATLKFGSSDYDSVTLAACAVRRLAAREQLEQQVGPCPTDRSWRDECVCKLEHLLLSRQPPQNVKKASPPPPPWLTDVATRGMDGAGGRPS